MRIVWQTVRRMPRVCYQSNQRKTFGILLHEYVFRCQLFFFFFFFLQKARVSISKTMAGTALVSPPDKENVPLASQASEQFWLILTLTHNILTL